MQTSKKPDYFGEALSDFTHDVASGRAIRHLVNRGCSVDEIMRSLDFPTSRSRVQRTVYEYLLKSGILLEELPGTEFEEIVLDRPSGAAVRRYLGSLLDQNGGENSYIACAYGMIYRDREARLTELLSCLTGRERDYVLGIPWERRVMYHRLTDRMTEIAMQLAVHGTADQTFCFLKTAQMVVVKKK